MKKIKILTIYGTRPEIIRLSRVLARLDESVDHVTVHTGQSYDYEMSKVFFENLKVRKPNYFLDVKAETVGKQIANIIERTEEVLIKEKPDAVLVLGDTNSALAAIVAKRLKIPICHMEAGNRCFDENVPEEINRKIVDHIADINLAYSENARSYLIREGVHPGSVFVTGSPIAEVYHFYKDKIESSNILEELKLEEGKYFVASLHREENVDSKESLANLVASLNAVAEKYKLPILVSTHPRTAKRLGEYKLRCNKLVNFHKPLGYFDYMKLQKKSLCVISDSGTILEEASVAEFPAIQARVSSERPEGYDEGVVLLTGLKKDIMLQGIEIAISDKERGIVYEIPAAYKPVNVSGKVLRHLIRLVGAKKIN